MDMIGYARYADNLPVNWRAGGVPNAGSLPSTKTSPAYWSDEKTAMHGFRITWNDFKGEAPMIADSWP
jgi:hypothetical protein